MYIYIHIYTYIYIHIFTYIENKLHTRTAKPNVARRNAQLRRTLIVSERLGPWCAPCWTMPPTVIQSLGWRVRASDDAVFALHFTLRFKHMFLKINRTRNTMELLTCFLYTRQIIGCHSTVCAHGQTLDFSI